MPSRSRRLLLQGMLCVVTGIAAPGDAFAQASVDLERERAELLQVHRNLRDAHFKTDIDLLLERNADELVSVRDGKITRRSKSDMRQAFSEYFRGATYHEWDDIAPPIFHVSQDATMGWMITTVKVRRTRPTSAGLQTEEFIYAGLSTYEKRGGRWMEVANASTFEPRR